MFQRGLPYAMALTVLALAVAIPQKAHALVGVGAVYGLTQSSQTGGNSTTQANQYTTYGALAELPLLASKSGLLLGVLYAEEGGHQVYTGYNYDVKLPYYEVPVLVNFWLSNAIAFGIGGYYGIPAANATETGTILNTFSTSKSDTFANLNWKNDDYGLAANVRIKIPLGVVYLSGDVIYQYGLENVSTVSGQTINNRTLLAMLGLGIGI